MATKKVRLKSTDKKDILHPETDDNLILNKKLLVEDSSNAFEIQDEQANTILEIDQQGNLRTSNFDSTNIKGIDDYNELKNKPILTDTSSNAFEISDENQNSILEIGKEGNLKTKNFDSDNIQYTDIKNKPILSENTDNAFEISDESGNILVEIDKQGVVKTQSFDSSNIGNVDDVKVDGKSVVENKIADIESKVKTETIDNAFEISDESGNVILEVDQNGTLITRGFDSSNIPDTSNVDDIQIDGTSILKDKIANIKKDEINNVADIQVDGATILQDKIANIDSSKFGKIDDVTLDDITIVSDKVAKLNSEDFIKVKDIKLDNESILDENKTANIESDKINKVTDILVNDSSVVTDKVAKITLPMTSEKSESALEICDKSGNTVLEVDATGNLKTKMFDSTDYYTKAEVDALIKKLTEKIETLSSGS